MKIYSLNVNGLNSAIEKGIKNSLFTQSPDIICLQEIKCQNPLIELDTYYSYWNYCSKKGYSGTVIFTKNKPLSINYNFNTEFDCEGRIITLEYEYFYIINVYVPNSKASAIRLDYRMKWDEEFYNYICELKTLKPIIICGDFNIAYSTIDSNDCYYSTEFVDNERFEFENLLNNGLIDAFRHLYPQERNCYTWWNVGKDIKENKLGYRLDYFLISDYLINNLIDSHIHTDINCSDHCPISIEMDFEAS